MNLTGILQGQERVRFEPEGHTYEVKGPDDVWRPYDAVTAPLKSISKGEGLLRWAAMEQRTADAKLAAEHGTRAAGMIERAPLAFLGSRDKARDVGTEVHAEIEHRIKRSLGLPSEAPDVSDQALWLADGWEKWAKGAEFRPLASEVRVFSHQLRICGTLDSIVLGLMFGEPVVIDWKTSKRIYPEHHIQVAAYRGCIGEMTGTEPGGMVVIVPRDGRTPKAAKSKTPLLKLLALYGAALVLHRGMGEAA